MKINPTNKGFTLVETLVAIAVLMIAIAGPLTVANKAYTSALDARNQSIAASLAQEGLEYVNNMKDNHAWYGGSGDSWLPYDTQQQVRPDIFNRCNYCLDLEMNGSAPNLPANFSRKYYLASVVNSNQVAVTVEVSWKTGLTEGVVRLNEILTNYDR